MKTYLITFFVLGCIATVVILFRIAVADYPRKPVISRETDVIDLAVRLGFLAWTSWLLFAANGGAS